MKDYFPAKGVSLVACVCPLAKGTLVLVTGRSFYSTEIMKKTHGKQWTESVSGESF